MTTRVGLGLALVALGSALATAGPRPQHPEHEAEAKALGRRAFVENCLMCHAEEMTSRQRLTARQWTAEVDKMIGWGAPVPAEHKALLVQYLIGSFSETVPPAPLETAPAGELRVEDRALAVHPAPRGDSAKGGPLYAQFCANCHGPVGQGGDLGTRLAGRPVLLDDARYREVVAKGLRRMPGFANALTPGAEDHVLAWLRERRDD
jgi:ubiquinol-cytochrome c reductase cytochrome c subunit